MVLPPTNSEFAVEVWRLENQQAAPCIEIVVQ